MWPPSVFHFWSDSPRQHVFILQIVQYLSPSLSISHSLSLSCSLPSLSLCLSLLFLSLSPSVSPPSLPGFNFQGCLPGSECQALLSRLPPRNTFLSLELTVMNEREGMGRGVLAGKSERRRDKCATNQNERKMLFKQNEWESHSQALP